MNIRYIAYVSLLLTLNTDSPITPTDTLTITPSEYDTRIHSNINTLDKLAHVFPKNVEEVNTLSQAAIDFTNQAIDEILNVTTATFDNTVRACDIAINKLKGFDSLIYTLGYVSPDTAVREAALEASTVMQQVAIDFFMNQSLYQKLMNYYENEFKNENLSDKQKLITTDYMRSFQRLGLHLPEATQKQIKQLKKDIIALEQEFLVTINNDSSYITVTHEELAGIDENFISQLESTNGIYKVPCKLSTAMPIMTNCSISETRKKMFIARNNIAYPTNEEKLIEFLKKRHELAELLGYENYASFDLSQTSAQNVENVENFLLPLAETCMKKQIAEGEKLQQELPTGVELQDNNTFNPWDYFYTYNNYIKKHFDIDENTIAEYFPAQKVIDGVFIIYQNFLGLTFKQVQPTWSWHEDVMLIEIYRASSHELLGYLFLDLYPRDNKYSHACVIPQIVSYDQDGQQNTSITTLITNVPKPSADKPALLKFDDVVTFFHEFGHAMHSVLSRTPHPGHSGINVAADFAEVPSQMFEQWMFEPDMLNIISGHYETGEALPQEIIENKIKLRSSNSGYCILRQVMIALFALRLMTNEELSYNPKALWKSLHNKYLSSFFKYEEQFNWFATFGHLAHDGYAAKYYSYLWTEVFAIDLFADIKKHNFNTEARKKAIDLLEAGGSIEAEKLLENFLGRKPNQKAFLSALGL